GQGPIVVGSGFGRIGRVGGLPRRRKDADRYDERRFVWGRVQDSVAPFSAIAQEIRPEALKWGALPRKRVMPPTSPPASTQECPNACPEPPRAAPAPLPCCPSRAQARHCVYGPRRRARRELRANFVLFNRAIDAAPSECIELRERRLGGDGHAIRNDPRLPPWRDR